MRLVVAGGLLCALACATVPRASPTQDTDQDGLVDVKDECPDEAGEPGGDGCPELPRIVLESGRIAIRGKIVFELNSAELLPRNARLLDALAKLMNESTQLHRVEVQGHTDDTGEDDFNVALSLQRAEAVRRALVDRGVDPKRLAVKGLGESEPLAPNETPEGRARNRRVELKVLE